MNFLRNRKVAFKLWLLLLPAALLGLAILGSFGTLVMQVFHESQDTYYDTLYKNTKLLLNADRDIAKAQLAVNTLVFTEDSISQEERDALITEYNDTCQQVSSQINEAIKNFKSDEELYKNYVISEDSKSLVYVYLDFDKDFTSWIAAYDAETGFGDYEEQNLLYSKLSGEIDTMTDILDSYTEKQNTNMIKSVSRSIYTQAGGVFLIMLVLVGVAIFLIRYLRDNIKKLTMNMNLLSENDLSFEVHNTNTRDELGLLSVSINKLTLSLRSILMQLSKSSEKLAMASGTMRTNSDEVTTSMHEISKTVGEIADGASSQAEESQQLVGEIMNLGEAVNKSSQSTNELSDASSKIMLASQEGLNSVNQLEEITMKNQEAFQSIFNIIDITSTNAGKIGEASAMISDIAKKTKLLALNASIEAASAGEAGKGFAVVAEEIRKLSEQSKNSTMVIDQIVKELTSNIKTASEASKDVKAAVKVQTASVGDTKEKYISIVSALDNINREIIALDAISKDMEKSRAVVADFGSNVSAISEEYAASTEETSATTEEVLAAMTNINQIGAEVDNLVLELKSLIDQFKLPEQTEELEEEIVEVIDTEPEELEEEIEEAIGIEPEELSEDVSESDTKPDYYEDDSAE